jgi:chromosome segregation ATPase
MRKIAFAVMLFAADGLCQTPAKEPDTLQALLLEVHQLRQDIEAMTVASQRVQIALYALQIHDAAVARAAQRLDSARDRRTGAESNRDHTASQIQGLEGKLASGTAAQAEAKELQGALSEMKSQIEGQTAEVQTLQAAEAEASTQLRNEQAKLGDVQDRIERLDKTLEKLSAGGK